MQQKPVLVVGGTTSGVGKTSIAVGLMAALRDHGYTVQAFKVGPDFIDPMHHEAATGRPSINLDGWMLSREQVVSAFHRHMEDADIAIVEGVMGLFDGRDGTTEAGSTAQIAKWLGAPVMLVLDCSAVARSAAAIVKGYQDFDAELCLGALLFNKVGGAAHTKWLCDAVASAGVRIPVLGGIPIDSTVVMQERYLGLHLPQDPTMPSNLIQNLGALVSTHVDLDQVKALASSAQPPPPSPVVAVAAVSGVEAVEEQEEAEMKGLKSSPLRDDTANGEEMETGASQAATEMEVEEEEILISGGGDVASTTAAAAAAPRSLANSSSSTSRPGSSNSKKKKKRKAKQNAAAAAATAQFLNKKQFPVIPTTSTTSDPVDVAAAAEEEPLAPEEPEQLDQNEDDEIEQAEEGEEEEIPIETATVTTATASSSSEPSPPHQQHQHYNGPPVRIAIARDNAFCFYYHDNLTLLEEAGAELIPFSPLLDPLPPGISGIYLGGGYPERHAAELADNKLLRAGLKAFAEAGGVIYAECGGLMFLSQSIRPRGEPPQPMVGVFPFKTVLPPGKYVMGYVEVETTAACPLFPRGVLARGHVHHASELLEEHHVGGVVDTGSNGDGGAATTQPLQSQQQQESAGGVVVGAAWRTGYLSRPQVPGAPESPEGFTRGNVLASYVHLHFGGCPELATALVQHCREVDCAAVSAAVGAAEVLAPMLEGSCTQTTPPSGSSSSLRLPVMPNGAGGMHAVRSSPDFHAIHSQRARSMDFNSRYSLHAPPPPPPLHHFGLKNPSPATTLNKVMSSGSLSTQHSGYVAQIAMLERQQAVDRASQHSESPLAISPRTNPGSEVNGYYYQHQHQQQYKTNGGGGGGIASQFYHSSSTAAPDAALDHHHQQQQQQQFNNTSFAPPPGLIPFPPHPQQHPPLNGPNSNSNNSAMRTTINPLAAVQQHHHQYQQHYTNPRYSHTFQGPSSGAVSEDGGGCNFGGSAAPSRSTSWAQLPTSTSTGALSEQGGGGSSSSAFQQQHHSHHHHHPHHHHQPQQQQQQQFQSRQQDAQNGGNGGGGSMKGVNAVLLQQHHHQQQQQQHRRAASMEVLTQPPLFAINNGATTTAATYRSDVFHHPDGLEPVDMGFNNHHNYNYQSATPHNWQNGFPPSDKIATLGPGATEMAWALGLGNRVVAVSDMCDYPEEVALRPKAAKRAALLISSSFASGTASTSTVASTVPSTAHSPEKPARANSSGSGGTMMMINGSSVPGSSLNLAALAAVSGGSSTSKSTLQQQQQQFSDMRIARVDDQVLARERPGLIVYEEEEPVVVSLPADKDEHGSSSSSTAAAAISLTQQRQQQQQQHAAGALGRAISDAVIAVELQSACRVLALRRSTLSDVLSAMLVLGDAAGIGDEAGRVVDRLRARLRRVGVESARAALSSSSVYTSRPRVLVLRSLNPLIAEGRWVADMVMLAGGEPGVTQPGDAPRAMTWSEITAFAPDVLVIAGMRDGSGPRTFHGVCAVAALPGWWLIPAVKSGAVFVCEEALMRRGGPRLVEGTESLARMVHGDGVSVCCPPRAVLKLSLRPGQRCRPRLLPNYFMAYC